MIIVNGGVTAPQGFFANGVKAGIKESGRKDLALIVSEEPAAVAAAFTTNVFKASPVRVSLDHLGARHHRAIIVNSGNANCANGKTGDRDARSMATFAARALAFAESEVLVASTGIIGRRLPIEKIRNAVPELVAGLSRSGGAVFSETIITTDTRKKELAVKVKLGSSVVTIGGACKGVGMIYPQLSPARHATMLCFITTDAAISRAMLTAALGEAMDGSFNMISVDGDMSTNDSCFLMANGLAGNRRITSRGSAYRKFTAALTFLAAHLAHEMVRDGEGATRFVAIEVKGARSPADARRIARKVSTSNLLKCCINGGDPNWGRVVAASGSSGVVFDPDRVDVYLGGVKVFANGSSLARYDTARVRENFRKKEVAITIDLKGGKASATAWTCDLSKKYVAINAEYST